MGRGEIICRQGAVEVAVIVCTATMPPDSAEIISRLFKKPPTDLEIDKTRIRTFDTKVIVVDHE